MHSLAQSGHGNAVGGLKPVHIPCFEQKYVDEGVETKSYPF